jgi:hypothetical protein
MRVTVCFEAVESVGEHTAGWGAASRHGARRCHEAPPGLPRQHDQRRTLMELRSGYEFEQGFTVKMSGHPDSKEALRAFAEHRPPVYRELDANWKIEG